MIVLDESNRLNQVKLSPVQARIYRALARGALLSGEDLVDIVYQHDANGGPGTGRKCIHVHILNLRQKLTPLGIVIKSEIGRGGGYRMVQP